MDVLAMFFFPAINRLIVLWRSESCLFTVWFFVSSLLLGTGWCQVIQLDLVRFGFVELRRCSLMSCSWGKHLAVYNMSHMPGQLVV